MAPDGYGLVIPALSADERAQIGQDDPRLGERAAQVIEFARLLRDSGIPRFPNAGLIHAKFGWSRRDSAAVLTALRAFSESRNGLRAFTLRQLLND